MLLLNLLIDGILLCHLPKGIHDAAHRHVQLLESCCWEETTIPVFTPYSRINLSLMEGQDGHPDAACQVWLRIHRSPDPFSIVERTKNTVRLQFDWFWLVISAHELDSLLAPPAQYAQAVQQGWSRGLEIGDC